MEFFEKLASLAAKVRLQSAAITGLPIVGVHRADACLVRIKARQQRRAGGTAARGVIELSESEAAGGKCVEIRRANIGMAVAAHVSGAVIVADQQQHVARRRMRRRSQADQ